MAPRLLLIETSHRQGFVALSEGLGILGQFHLNDSRRHARDLAPKINDLLQSAHWEPKDLNGVLVSRGPGSYTGLRVGIMSAKTLAYALGIPLLAMDTFSLIAQQTPAPAQWVDVLADAQQRKIYVQRFLRSAEGWTPQNALEIVSFEQWVSQSSQDVWVTGPGCQDLEPQMKNLNCLPSSFWFPQPETMLQLGLKRLNRGEKDDVFAVEPLYLRVSSAEEKWKSLGRA